MKNKLKKWLRPSLFTLGGMTAGYLYYLLAGCSSGGCLLGSNPIVSILYLGFIGWLLSGIGQCCNKKCDR